MGIAFEAGQECPAPFAPPSYKLSSEQAVHFPALRGLDIVKRQARVIRKDRLRRHAGGEFAQNELQRNARSTNDRFAVHDVRAHFDAGVGQSALSVRS